MNYDSHSMSLDVMSNHTAAIKSTARVLAKVPDRKVLSTVNAFKITMYSPNIIRCIAVVLVLVI